jgi:hypothetical protein
LFDLEVERLEEQVLHLLVVGFAEMLRRQA